MSLFNAIKNVNKGTYLFARSGVQHQNHFVFKRGAKGIVIEHDERHPEYEYPEKTSVRTKIRIVLL